VAAVTQTDKDGTDREGYDTIGVAAANCTDSDGFDTTAAADDDSADTDRGDVSDSNQLGVTPA
jgi:hypothetical protein